MTLLGLSLVAKEYTHQLLGGERNSATQDKLGPYEIYSALDDTPTVADLTLLSGKLL